MSDKIHPYRQPMVTATGIFLGFILNFSSTWVSKAFKSDRNTEIIIATSLIISICLLLSVLYRILNMDEPKKGPEKFYKRTLIYFIAGMAISFLSIVIVLFESFFMYYTKNK